MNRHLDVRFNAFGDGFGWGNLRVNQVQSRLIRRDVQTLHAPAEFAFHFITQLFK